MATLPTLDQAFGPDVPQGGLPTADQAFGGAPGFVEKSDLAIQQSTYNILNAFGHGAKGGFGEAPITPPEKAFSPDTEKALKSYGILGNANGIQTMFDALLRTSAAGAELMGRVAGAGIGGVAEMGAQTLEELGLIEEGQAKGTGAGAATDPFVQLLVGGAFPETKLAPRPPDLETVLNRARAKGVIGEGEAGFYDAAPLTPENTQARIEAAKEAGVLPPPPPELPPDVHALARRIEPEAFQKFDSLTAEKDQHRTTLKTLADQREASPEAQAAAADIKTILGKVHGVEERLTQKAAERLAEAQDRLTTALKSDTPEMAKTRQALLDADIAQRDLVPTVSGAYRQAQDMMPPEETPPKPTEALPIPEQITAEAPKEPAPTEAAPAGEAPTAAVKSTRAVGGPLKTVEGTGALKTLTLAEGVEAMAIENKLTDGFGDLPEYREVSMADQAAKAIEVMNKDYEAAKAMAMGTKAPPKDVLNTTMFVAVEKRANLEGDINLLQDLATRSRVPEQAKSMGQNIRMLGERDPTSPLGAIQEVQAAREEDLAKRGDLEAAKTATVNEMKAAIKKTTSPRATWEDFINTITCEG